MMMLMVCTPDFDKDAKVANMDARARAAAEHFHNKQRRFKFQFQFHLKERPPSSEVYIDVEFNDLLKMGMVQRAVSMARLVYVHKTNPSFHYLLTGGSEASIQRRKRGWTDFLGWTMEHVYTIQRVQLHRATGPITLSHRP